MPKGASFPIPLKFFDVIRSTHTDLDVAQEKRIDDSWNVEGNRNLSDLCKGFTSFTLLNEILRKDICGPEETDKNPNDITSRSHMVWRLDKNWKNRARKRDTRMGNRGTKTRKSQKLEMNLFYWSKGWRVQRHHLTARRKLKTPKAAAMPCKRALSQASIRETVVSKTEKPRHLKRRQDSIAWHEVCQCSKHRTKWN